MRIWGNADLLRSQLHCRERETTEPKVIYQPATGSTILSIECHTCSFYPNIAYHNDLCGGQGFNILNIAVSVFLLRIDC